MADLVYRRLDGSGPAEEAFDCVAEACSNVSHHAGVSGWACAQTYDAGSPSARVVLGVADAGQGITNSLRSHHGTLGDEGALRLVVERHASAAGGFAATGIYGMVGIVDDLGGTLVVRSGSAFVRRRGRCWTYREGENFAGTALGVELPCA